MKKGLKVVIGVGIVTSLGLLAYRVRDSLFKTKKKEKSTVPQEENKKGEVKIGRSGSPVEPSKINDNSNLDLDPTISPDIIIKEMAIRILDKDHEHNIRTLEQYLGKFIHEVLTKFMFNEEVLETLPRNQYEMQNYIIRIGIQKKYEDHLK
jgi:hypothetical protein